MSMFAVTVFAVVVLGGYTSSFAAVSGDFVQESEGDFEVLLSGSRAPVGVGTDPAAWGLVPQQAERIDAVAAVSRAVVVLDGQNVPYLICSEERMRPSPCMAVFLCMSGTRAWVHGGGGVDSRPLGR